MVATLFAATLAILPGDLHGFVHVPAPALYAHPMMKGMRDAVAAAGPDARKAFDKQVYPHPDTLAGLTLFLPKTDNNNEPMPVGLLSFTAPVDGTKLRLLYLPNAKPETVGGKTIFWDGETDLAVYFPDAKHVAVGRKPALERWFAAPPVNANHALAAAMKLAAGGDKIVAAVDVTSLPFKEQDLEQIPPPFRPLAKAKMAIVSFDLASPDPVITVRAGYADAAAAAEAEKGVKAAAQMAKGQMKELREGMEKELFSKADAGPQSLEQMAKAAGALIGLGGMNQADALLDNPPVKIEGTDLVASVTIPKEVTGLTGMYTSAIGAGLLLPAVQKVREAAARTTGQNNLKQIGLAFHNYESAYGKLPTAAICDPKGKKLLSWRVAILPYIEQDALYRQFKLDEPWDSEHNKKLVAIMPKIYISPRFEHGAKDGKTTYKAFVGGGAMFDWNKASRFVDISDGTSNTLMAVEGGEPVIWTKPDDIEFDAAKDAPNIAPAQPGIPGVNVLFGDGSVRYIQLATLKPATLKAYITRAGGEVINE
jgi:prepilin-type processing-associated H-X9-DG protein